MKTPDPFEYLGGGPEPVASADEQAQARRRLDAAIAQETNQLAKGRIRRRLILVGTLLGTAGVAVSGLWRRFGVSSTVNRMTAAIRATTQPDVPDGSFSYFRSDRADLVVRPATDFGLSDRSWVAYIQPATREVWRSHDLRFLQVTTILRESTPIDPELAIPISETLAGTIGEPTTQRFLDVEDPLLEMDWPTDASRLRRAMEAYLGHSNDDRSLEAGLFELAGQLVRETWRSPETRAAVLEVIAALPITTQPAPSPARQTFSLTYQDSQKVRLDLSFSPLGYLSAESLTLLEDDPELRIPAGTAISRAQHASPEIRSEL